MSVCPETALVEWGGRLPVAAETGVPCFCSRLSFPFIMFDPLHQWLGIAPVDQPPDHYRLLGLSRFESNPDVIDAASDRHLAFLHGMINGPHAKEAEELANKISTVRLCLLNDTKRKAYDESLRAAEKPDPAAGWLITHGDGQHHGPFDWPQIQLAVQQGRFSSSTHLFHTSETGGQWVLASKLLRLPAVVPEAPSVPQGSRATSDRPDRTPPVIARTVPGRRSRSNFGLQQLVVLVVVPGVILFAVLYFLIQNPEQHSRLGTMVLDAVNVPFGEGSDSQPIPTPSGEAQEGQAEPTVVTTDDAADAGSQMNPDASESSGSESAQPSVSPSPPSQSMTVPSSSSPSTNDQAELDAAFFSMDKTTNSTTKPGSPASPSIDPSKTREVKIELTKSRSADKVGDFKEGNKLRIVAVQGGPAKYEIVPADGELKFGPITKVVFPELFGLTLNCSLQRDSDDSIEFVCKPEWSYVGNRLAPFTVSRVEKVDKEAEEAMKQYTLALEKAKQEQTQAEEASTQAQQSSVSIRARYAAQERAELATRQKNSVQKEYDKFKTRYDSWKIIHQAILGMQADGRVVLEVLP
jgi:hypothetical protein